ncbi:hypothetical protein [Actinomadura chibensis]|uniref:Uncharacterized protein n=1 Tax=Actinomadura chibensis TaxID=392828 RepID=A0A5D0N9J4_9ACTN|nr:hypothetical protein [Actinomadura chibensis]TYB40999.1 hypothetical protein FXF69_39070 [Actinomadura chibensis]
MRPAPFSITVRLPVSFGTYFLAEEESPLDDGGIGQIFSTNTLATVTGEGHAAFMAGTHTGDITLTLTASDSEPRLNVHDWDTVVDLTFDSPHGNAVIIDADGEEPPALRGRSPMRGVPGRYRIRIQARGRNAGHLSEGQIPANQEPPEHHHICVWLDPNAAVGETIHQLDSFAGA